MSADSPRRLRGIAVPAIVPPQVVSDRSILDSAIGFINDVTLANQPHTDAKDTITWARFESAADISDPRFGGDWELEGNVAPPLLLILGYGLGVQVWAIPANGEAVEVLSWRHGIVSVLRILPTPASSTSIDENGRADEQIDAYIDKRPLIALVDSGTSPGIQPTFSSVNFVSLKSGVQQKTIKFKNPVLDILANRSSVVITFHERIAVFDARSLEDRLSVTTCYPSPGINPNPVALGPRWLAYAEQKLIHSKRSGGGCDGDGVASYTATVLNAAKSFGKGLRELGEQVAAGLTGTTASGGISKNSSSDSITGVDSKQPGIVTVLDTKYPIKDYSPNSGTPTSGHTNTEPILAHFIAHSEAVVAMEFDNSGMLLLTADRRGHDFHVFRIQPHPVGPCLAAVHHLYVLHRGDTSAKVQNITFSLDSRWAAVSTLRGTTHVFPITPYGGQMGVRTHSSLHVVNKLSRFHRSAGLSADGRSSSPISHSESTTFVQSLHPYHNPTLPPFSRPIVVLPLAQLRQPLALGSPPGSTSLGVGGKSGISGGSSSSQRQRLSSLSDDNGKPLSVCAIFAKSRSWLLDPPNVTREAPHRIQRKAVDSLFVMAGHGALIQYDLDTKLASNVAKEKICDDTPIELEVEAKAQWNVGRRKEGSQEVTPPLSSDNWLIKNRNSFLLSDSTRHFDDLDDRTESWLSQVEIITHAGPHRRLWMGPQFVFKTYNTPSGSNLNHVDAEAVEVGISKSATATTAAAASRVERSSPLNMPLSATGRSGVPVLIESGSYSSIEQSPKLMDRFRHDRHEHLESDYGIAHGDIRLKEDLADAMRESPSVSAAHKDTGRLHSDAASSDNVPFYDALAEHDDDDQAFDSHRSVSAAALASVLPYISSYETRSGCESMESLKETKPSIEKVVNPLGTVTIVSGMADVQTDILDEVVSQLADEECVIHENCDESLFRPVVAIFCDDSMRKCAEEMYLNEDDYKPPEVITNKLIVPVIAKEVDAEITKKEKKKNGDKMKLQRKMQEQDEERRKLAELSNSNKKVDTKNSRESIVIERESVNMINDFDGRNMNSTKEREKVGEEDKEGIGRSKTADVKVGEEDKEGIGRSQTADVKVGEEDKEGIGRSKTADVVDFVGLPLGEAKDKQKLKNKPTEIVTELKSIEPHNLINQLEVANEKKDNSQKWGRKPGTKVENPGTAKVKSPDAQKSAVLESTSIEKEFLMEPKLLSAEISIKETAGNVIISATDKTALTEPTTSAVATIKSKTKQEAKAHSPETELSTKVGGANEAARPSKVQSFYFNECDLVDSLIDIKIKDDRSKTKKPKCKYPHCPQNAKIIDTYKTRRPSKPEAVWETVEKYKSLSESFTKDLQNAERKLMEVDTVTDKPPEINTDTQKSEKRKENNKNVRKQYSKPEHGEQSQNPEYQEKFNILKKTTTNIKEPEDKKNEPKDRRKVDIKETGEDIKNTKIAPISFAEVLDGKERNCRDNVAKDNCKNFKANDKNLDKSKEPKGAIKKSKNKKDTVNPTEMETIYGKDSEHVIDSEDTRTDVKCDFSVKKPSRKSGENMKEESYNNPQTKSVAEVVKSGTEFPPSAVAITTPTADRKASILEEADLNKESIKLITENPSKKKACISEGKPSIKEDTKQKEHTKLSIINAEKEVCWLESKKGVQNKPNNFKIISTDATTDGPPGDNSRAENLAGEKRKVPSGIKLSPGATNLKCAEAPIPVIPLSPWKTLSGAEMINRNLGNINKNAIEENCGTLSKSGKGKKSTKPKLLEVETYDSEIAEKLLDLPTPLKALESYTKSLSNSAKNSSYTGFYDFSPLEALPPMKGLQALEVVADVQEGQGEERKESELSNYMASQQASLINFESPSDDNSALERKVAPTPRGYTEDNCIFALCGSLHYEDENTKLVPDNLDSEPKLCSSHTEGFFKAANEKTEKLLLTSRERNSANNKKLSSSPNSSASEEIIVLEEKKMSKKQKRKKQQIELQKPKEQHCANEVEVDEELRPLISMTDSQIDNYAEPTATNSKYSTPLPACAKALFMNDVPKTVETTDSGSVHTHSSTTDSEGPMPATTSDDNIFALPSTSTANTPNKLKTKKLEYKINLIGAIEAATSSSTSSAEESGMEIGGCATEAVGGTLVSVTATPALPLSHSTVGDAPQGGAKKKTKRRKR